MLQIKLTTIIAIVAVIIGITVGSLVTLNITKATKPMIQVVEKVYKCPEQQPCNGIDFDKIKSKYLTINNKQYLTINGDSILVSEIVKGITTELAKINH